MVPLEGWYDARESATPSKIVGTLGGGVSTSDSVDFMSDLYGQNSWFPAATGQKLFHEDPPLKTSCSDLGTERNSDAVPVQEESPFREEWSDQTLANLLYPTTSSAGIEYHGGRNDSDEMIWSLDARTAFADPPPQNMYAENYVSKVTGPLGPPTSTSTGFERLKVGRNRENLFAADTSSSPDHDQSVRSTPFLSLGSVHTGDCLPSTMSESNKVGLGNEVRMKEFSVEQVPSLIHDGNENMPGIREAVSSMHVHSVQKQDISQPSIQLERSQPSDLSRQGGHSETENPQIPFQGKVNELSGKSVEASSPPLTAAVSAEQLASQVQTASLSCRAASAGRNYPQDGSTHPPQLPYQQVYGTTPPLQHSSQPKQQTVGVHESFRSFGNGCSSNKPAPREQLQSTLVGLTGQDGLLQMQNSSRHNFMNRFEYDACYASGQQSFPQRSLVDAGFEGVNPDGSRSHSDSTPYEVLVLEQLQAAVRQLDVGTRTCIRDALYRLARSAKERRSFRGDDMSEDFAELDTVTASSCLTGVSSWDFSRSSSETQTNHLDRLIASLMFNAEPYWKHSQEKFQSVADIPSGPWHWPYAVAMCSDWGPPPNDHVESGDGRLSMPSDNFVNFTDKASSSSSYEPLGTQEQRVNTALSSNVPPLISTNHVLSLDMSGLASQSTALREDTRPQGISRGHRRREVESGINHSFEIESMLVSGNQQSGSFTPCSDVGGNDITLCAGLQENSRFVDRVYNGAGSLGSNFPSRPTHPGGYGLLTVKNRGGQRFGPDMNSLATSHCNRGLKVARRVID